jgi:transcription antitermination protein NusB
VNDRPKTMAERTARPRTGDNPRQRIKVVDGKLSGAEPAVELVGTSLSAALADAQAAGAPAAWNVESGSLGPGEDPAVSASAGTRDAAPTTAGAITAHQTADAHIGGRRSEARSKPQGTATKPTAASTKAKHAFAASRSVARKIALQAIYRWLLNDAPWQDLVKEFGEAEDMPNADPRYFRDLVEGITGDRKSLDERLSELLDRPVEQLDPVEHSVLLIGLYELSAKPDVPYRVAINEAVGLAKRFGATDGHKFVNAVLDRAARKLRPGEN